MSEILIVEDEHDTRVWLCDALEAEGYRVHSAANGLDALNLLREIEPPALIILDLKMPLMSGEAFLKTRDENPEWAAIPVVVLSGQASFPELPTAQGLLKKPIDRLELVDLADRYCRP